MMIVMIIIVILKESFCFNKIQRHSMDAKLEFSNCGSYCNRCFLTWTQVEAKFSSHVCGTLDLLGSHSAKMVVQMLNFVS